VKILIASADETSRRVLRADLAAANHELWTVKDGHSAWTVLERPDETPEVAFLDLQLPRIPGADLAARLRMRGRPHVHVIALAPREELQAALDMRPHDVLHSPIDAGDLRARMLVAAWAVEEHAALEGTQEQLRTQALLDPATGLWNQRAILEALRRELARAQRDLTTVSVALVGVDRLRQVNDVQGHAVGDLVLHEVGARVRSQIRTYDGIGRFAGDQFLLVLPRCGASDAKALGERIRLAIASDPVNTVFARTPVTASLGLASALPGQTDPSALVSAAEAALVRAKLAGRNRIEASTRA
jgi:two-component system chemotaxis response regulator CheY